MELLTISVARVRTIPHRGAEVRTGIYKEPVPGVHRVGFTGLETDLQVDLENHGGPDKAIYVYTEENYRFWQGELGRTWPHGQFGENFTVSGMPDETVHIGDVFRIGGITAQVTQPRVPCFKLGVKMGDPRFVKRFHQSGRVGFYLRILATGSVTAGENIELLEADPNELNIHDAMLAMIPGEYQQESIARVLAVPALSAAWRKSLEKRRK
jgi:MOSC domain-containing protein YiiM